VGNFLDPCHDNWSGVSTPLNFRKKIFFRSNCDKKILKVRKFQPGRITGYKTLVETEVGGVVRTNIHHFWFFSSGNLCNISKN